MTHEDLIDELIRGGHLKTSEIIDAFRAIDRKDFVPVELVSRAYEDTALPIGYDQTISQPLTVAFMLELLEPHENQTILDVGVGSGWQTALLAYIACRRFLGADEAAIGPKVMGLEVVPELMSVAEENISKYGFIARGFVDIIHGDARKGVPDEKYPRYGFDRIIAAAAAEGDIPAVWKRQLAVGGRIVAPVGNSIVVFDKKGKDAFIKKEYEGFRFVPLVKGSE